MCRSATCVARCRDGMWHVIFAPAKVCGAFLTPALRAVIGAAAFPLPGHCCIGIVHDCNWAAVFRFILYRERVRGQKAHDALSTLAVVIEKLDATPTTIRGEAAMPVSTAVRNVALAVWVVANDIMAASVVPSVSRASLSRPAPNVTA